MKYVMILILFLVPVKLKDEIISEIDLTKEKEIVLTEDLKCLADNIYHEAKGESLRGKQAVAQITLNRTKSDGFPSDICNVVYERSYTKKKRLCQFSWTCQHNMQVIQDEHYEDSINIAYAVLNNDVRNEKLNNALYFHADYVNPKWKKKRITKIGKHIFY